MATAVPRARPLRVPRRAAALLLAAAALALGYAAYRRHLARRPYEWSGTVEARDIAVGSRVGGRVSAVLAREGEQVQAGQPLLLLEPGDLDAQRLQAQGQLEQARATLERLRRGPRQEDLDGARAQLRAAEVALGKAGLDARRARELARARVVPDAELDAREAALRNARAQRDALRAALLELEHGSRPEELRAAAGAVQVAEGRLQAIQSAIGELTVRAPRAARVETLDLRPGDLLTPNATAATLLEEGELYVRIYVPETQLGAVRPGQDVPVYVDTFPGRGFQGVVEQVGHRGEFSPRNLQTADERANQVFAARVGLREGREVLRAGMAAFVRVPR